MAEADLGVRVFLIDNLSSPMGLVTGSIAMLGSALLSGMSQAEGMGLRIDELKAKLVAGDAEMAALADTQNTINMAWADGNLTLQEAGTLWESADLKMRDVQDQSMQNRAELDALESSASGLNATLMLLGGTLGAGIDFGAFALGIKAADSAASDLQDTMNQVSIAGNLTNDQLGQMQDYLFRVANTSIYTADEVGKGFSLLEEKGYGASQIMAGMGQQAVNLSEAIGTPGQGAVGATNLLATAMEVMKAKASDASHYADLLAFAFYNGIPDVDGLRSALEQVGGRASMLHIPFDQLIAALDSLGRAGMTGQQAGASLNYALQALYAPITKTQHELEYLGIISIQKNVTPQLDALSAKFRSVGASMPNFDGTVSGLEQIFKAGQKAGAIPLDATFYQWAVDNHTLSDAFYTTDGKAKDLMDTLHVLYGKLKGLNPEELAAAMQQLFNVRSSQGIAQLMSALGRLDGTYKGLKKSNDAAGLASEDAGKRMNSQGAQAKALQTTFTDFLAQVGKPFQDFFQNLFANLNKVVGAFTTGSPQVHQFFTSFLTAGAVLSGVALVIGLVAVAVFALDGALLPIIGIVLGVMVVIALLAAGWAFLQLHMKQVMTFLNPFIQEFQNLMKYLNFSATIDELKQAFTMLLPALKIVGMILGGIVIGVIAVLAGVIMGLIFAVGALAKGFATTLTGAILVVGGVLTFIKGIFQVVWGAISGVFYLLTGQPQKATEAFHGMLNGFVNMGKGVVMVFVGMWDMVKGVFIGVFGAIGGFVVGFILGIIHFFQGLADTLVHHSIIPDMILAIARWFFLLPGMVIIGIAQFVSSVVQGAIHAAQGFGDNLRNGIMHAISWLLSVAPSWGVNLIQGFINGITSMIGNVGNAVSGVVNTVKNFLGFHSPAKEGPGSDADQWMPNLMHMLTIGIQGGIPGMHSAASQAAGALQSGFYSPGINRASSSYAQANASINGGNTTVPINIDGQAVTTVVLNRLTGQVQMSGSGRLLR